MAKNDKGTWVGKTMQPTFQTYPTAGMIQPAASSSTAPSSTPATNTPPPPSNILPPLTPTLPIGNITIGEGGGYPIIGDITVPNEYLQQAMTQQADIGPGAVTPDLAMNAPRLKLVNAVMGATSGPNVGTANASTMRGGQGSFYNIRRNN